MVEKLERIWVRPETKDKIVEIKSKHRQDFKTYSDVLDHFLQNDINPKVLYDKHDYKKKKCLIPPFF
jgi:hypothetical protein